MNNVILTKVYKFGRIGTFVGNKAKGQISKWVFQKNKAGQIFQKANISYPLTRTRTYAHHRVRHVCFLENLACCFLETSVLRFALLRYY